MSAAAAGEVVADAAFDPRGVSGCFGAGEAAGAGGRDAARTGREEAAAEAAEAEALAASPPAAAAAGETGSRTRFTPRPRCSDAGLAVAAAVAAAAVPADPPAAAESLFLCVCWFGCDRRLGGGGGGMDAASSSIAASAAAVAVRAGELLRRFMRLECGIWVSMRGRPLSARSSESLGPTRRSEPVRSMLDSALPALRCAAAPHARWTRLTRPLDRMGNKTRASQPAQGGERGRGGREAATADHTNRPDSDAQRNPGSSRFAAVRWWEGKKRF